MLSPNLFEPSLIILDNAKYHKCRRNGTPNPNKMRKHELLAELETQGVHHNRNITAVEAKVLLREWQHEHVKLEIIEVAEEQDHSVPYYSDLKPIELVWARVKAAVAKEYSRRTIFRDVGTHLQKQFDEICGGNGSQIVGSIIHHVDKRINRFLTEISVDESYDEFANDEGDETESETFSELSEPAINRSEANVETESDSE